MVKYIKTICKFGLLSLEAYKVYKDEKLTGLEKIKKLFDLGIKDAELLKEIFDLLVVTGSFVWKIAFNSLTLEIISKDQSSERKLVKHIKEEKFKKQLEEIFLNHEIEIQFEDVICSSEEVEVEINFEDLKQIAKKANQKAEYVFDYSQKSVEVCDISEKKTNKSNVYPGNRRLEEPKDLEDLLKNVVRIINPNEEKLAEDDLIESDSENETSSLQELFDSGKDSQSYLEAGKHEEAYELEMKRVKWVEKFGLKILSVSDLLQCYVVLLEHDELDKSTFIGNQLFNTLFEFGATVEDALKLARYRLKGGNLLESLFFSLLAQDLCFQQKSFDFNKMTKVVKEIMDVSLNALFHKKLSPDMIRKLISLTLWYAIQGAFQIYNDLPNGNPKTREAVAVAELFFLLSRIQHASGDNIECTKSLKTAIEFCKQVFCEKAEELKIFGICLHYLGYITMEKRHFKEAKTHFQKAKSALKKAEDFTQVDQVKSLKEFNESCLIFCAKKIEKCSSSGEGFQNLKISKQEEKVKGKRASPRKRCSKAKPKGTTKKRKC